MILELEIKEELSAVKDKIAEIRREQGALENNLNYLLGYERALEKALDESFGEKTEEPMPNFNRFRPKDPRDTTARLDDPIVPNDCYGSQTEGGMGMKEEAKPTAIEGLEEYNCIETCLCNLRDKQCDHVELWNGEELETCLSHVKKFRIVPRVGLYEVWVDDNDYFIPVTHAIEREKFIQF